MAKFLSWTEFDQLFFDQFHLPKSLPFICLIKDNLPKIITKWNTKLKIKQAF